MPASDYVIQVDTIHDNVNKVPADAIAVMGYDTGSPGIDWTPENWNRFPTASKVIVDQSPGLSQFRLGKAHVADVERGAATVETFISAARERLHLGVNAGVLYISYGSWHDAAIKLDISGLGGGRVRFFLADYSWSMTESISFLDKNSSVVGVQFASPQSNPHTDLPGTGLTLSEANCDLSVKRANWIPAPVPAAIGWRE